MDPWKIHFFAIRKLVGECVQIWFAEGFVNFVNDLTNPNLEVNAIKVFEGQILLNSGNF